MRTIWKEKKCRTLSFLWIQSPRSKCFFSLSTWKDKVKKKLKNRKKHNKILLSCFTFFSKQRLSNSYIVRKKKCKLYLLSLDSLNWIVSDDNDDFDDYDDEKYIKKIIIK